MKFAIIIALSVFVACSKKGAREAAPTPVTEPDRGRDEAVGGAPAPPAASAPAPESEPGQRNLATQVLLDGDLEMVGSMGKDAVRKVMKDNVTKLQFCYEQTLMMNPGIEGKVLAKFTIEPQGSVSDVKCDGVHPDVEQCVEKAVKELKFPPSAAKVEVSYPFTFKPA